MKTPLLFLAVLYCISCRKPNSADLDAHLVKSRATDIQAANISPCLNAKNPYESVGLNHNKIIWRLLEKIHEKKDTSRAFRKLFIIDLGKKTYGIDASKAIGAMDNKLKSCNYDLRKLLAGTGITTECAQDLIRIEAILKTLKAGNSYERFYKQIVDLESSIATKPYTEKEKKVLFIAASIARHSAYIWNPVVAMPQRFFLIDWGVAVVEYFANAHTDFLAAVGGALMGLSLDEIDIMVAEESEGAVDFIDNYWG